MSLGARTTKGGAKAGAKETKHAQEKTGKGTEKPPPKEKVKPQATTEQLRIAQMIDRKTDDPSLDVKKMVSDLMDMTRRSEEEVCSALHDADNDMLQACYLLLDDSQRIQGEWQTNEKRKKKPPAPAGNGEVEPPARDPRSRSGPRTRRGESDGARGRGGGRGRGAARGRGGRRGAPARGRARPALWHADHEEGGNAGDSFPATEDWDNEEWSGSLSDTKVFTPSTTVQNAGADETVPQNNSATEDWDAMGETNNGHSEAHIPTYTYHNTNHTPAPHAPHEQQRQSGGVSAGAAAGKEQPTSNTLESYVSTHQHQPMGMSGSLSAAQSQYLSQLTQQSQRHETSVYTSNYAVYGSAEMSNQRKPQRARVPPPSKIPSSAVEMPPAPGAAEAGAAFLDVQFGALEPDDAPEPAASPAHPPKPVTSQTESQPVSSHETPTEPSTYPNSAGMLNESLSAVDTTTNSQSSVASEATVTNTSLESQLSASMKQLSAGAAAEAAPAPAPAPHHHQPYAPHRTKSVGQQSVYTHHAVSHHPPVYGANVYAPQVNSTNASLTAASPMTATYPPASLSQYQANINSYQTSSSASVYGGNALYTAAPYTAYQHHAASHHKLPAKDTTQYDASPAPSASAPAAAAGPAAPAGKAAATTAGFAAGAAPPFYSQPGGAAGQYAYDDQIMRGTLPHHMGGYYEVGYGVGVGAVGAVGGVGAGVGGARDAGFGLGAGERFGRADAASPQQVAAALPPGYAYFYQPPPTTYQYGVYPTYGGGGSNVGVGSSVTGVGGVGGAAGAAKVNTYAAQQQPPYDAQDSYKPSGPYSGSGSKSGAAAADLTNAMYAKSHVALNKVNSYDKAFHSGTPPPGGVGGVGGAPGAFGAGSHHLYIAQPPAHHHALHHHNPPHQQPQHQMDVRVTSNHSRRESGSGGARNASSAKPAASKPTFSQSYWAPN